MKNNRDTFLEQPRRGNTHGAQLAIVLLILALAHPLAAQHRDTLYVVEEEPVYDTLFVHDTLHTYDTVSLDEHIHSKYPKKELSISYGVFPIIGVFNFGEYRVFREFDDLCPFLEKQPILSGSVNLQYHHYLNKYNVLNIDVSWAMYKHHNMIAVENSYKYGNQYLHFISAQIGYSIYYFHKGKVTLYSSVYLGGTLYYIGTLWDHYDTHYAEYLMGTSPVMTLKPALHINWVGIRIGEHNAATFELGFGTQGVLKFGYSYRF